MRIIAGAILAFALLMPAGQALAASRKGRSMETIELKSSAFQAGQAIPKRHSCEGEDVSPQLSWSGLPKGTTTLALIMDDPDAPPGTWVHWVLFDLPGDAKGLDEGVPKNETLANGAVNGRCWGVEEFERNGYYGPCPPPGKPHHYHFKLYALDGKLGLKPSATKNDVLKAMKGHVLGQGELIGTYKR